MPLLLYLHNKSSSLPYFMEGRRKVVSRTTCSVSIGRQLAPGSALHPTKEWLPNLTYTYSTVKLTRLTKYKSEQQISLYWSLSYVSATISPANTISSTVTLPHQTQAWPGLFIIDNFLEWFTQIGRPYLYMRIF